LQISEIVSSRSYTNNPTTLLSAITSSRPNLAHRQFPARLSVGLEDGLLALDELQKMYGVLVALDDPSHRLGLLNRWRPDAVSSLPCAP
jgi:hypothetical protein